MNIASAATPKNSNSQLILLSSFKSAVVNINYSAVVYMFAIMFVSV
jgi:hypothetical protein